MKKFLLPAFLILAGCVSLELAERFNPGAYEGSAGGYYGPVVVLVDTDSSSILNIRLVEQEEDEFIGGDAIRTLRAQILETDSTDLDAVSGATVTSNAFLDAVNNALEKARIHRSIQRED
jgi:fumarate reductase flavoprotein subunit